MDTIFIFQEAMLFFPQNHGVMVENVILFHFYILWAIIKLCLMDIF